MMDRTLYVKGKVTRERPLLGMGHAGHHWLAGDGADRECGGGGGDMDSVQTVGLVCKRIPK